MRKLTTELIIFVLLTPPLLAAGAFVYLYRTSHRPIAIDLKEFPTFKDDSKRMDNDALVKKYEAIIRKVIPEPPSNSELVRKALFLGLYGFPAGLAAWIFYRVARFAIKN